MFAALPSLDGLLAVGHRVVHGGDKLYRPTLIDDADHRDHRRTRRRWPRCTIRRPCSASRKPARLLPDLPHVAVFDTAFFHDLPPAAAEYAIDREVAETWHIRRYGFHGTSHRYVSEQAAAFLDAPLESLNQIVLHLGNGPRPRRSPAGVPSTPPWD